MRICLFIVFSLSLSGCGLFGPQGIANRSPAGPGALSAGRVAYAEALSTTEDQQLLLAILKKRYNESLTLVRVNSITANMQVSTNANVELGFGPTESFEGNLVPFSGGFAYEENPTISYAPIQGHDFLRFVMAPIPIDILVLAMRGSYDKTVAFSLLISEINGVSSPIFWQDTPAYQETRYAILAKYFEEMIQKNQLSLVQLASTSRPAFEFRPFEGDDNGAMREVFRILQLDASALEQDRVWVPIYLTRYRRGLDGIAVVTPSIDDLLNFFAKSVDVPEEDVESGAASGGFKGGKIWPPVRIYRADKRPENAAATLFYRGSWYYIDDTDRMTKQVFQILHTIVQLSMPDTEGGKEPLLMVPVSQ